jgi:hypothetical protein
LILPPSARITGEPISTRGPSASKIIARSAPPDGRVPQRVTAQTFDD